jgi:uncharacterized membrane protein
MIIKVLVVLLAALACFTAEVMLEYYRSVSTEHKRKNKRDLKICLWAIVVILILVVLCW